MAWNDEPPSKEELSSNTTAWDSAPPNQEELGGSSYKPAVDVAKMDEINKQYQERLANYAKQAAIPAEITPEQKKKMSEWLQTQADLTNPMMVGQGKLTPENVQTPEGAYQLQQIAQEQQAQMRSDLANPNLTEKERRAFMPGTLEYLQNPEVNPAAKAVAFATMGAPLYRGPEIKPEEYGSPEQLMKAYGTQSAFELLTNPINYLVGGGTTGLPLKLEEKLGEAVGKIGEKGIITAPAAIPKQEKLMADYQQTETNIANQILSVDDNVSQGLLTPEQGDIAKEIIKSHAAEYDKNMTDKIFSAQVGDTEFGKLLKENEGELSREYTTTTDEIPFVTKEEPVEKTISNMSHPELEEHILLNEEKFDKGELSTAEAKNYNTAIKRLAFENHVTFLPNKAAFNLAEKKSPAPYQGLLDLDSLKWYNDNIGYEAGNAALRAKAEVLKSLGLDVYHIGGDEFYLRSFDIEKDRQKLQKAQELLGKKKFEFELTNGTRVEVTNAGFSYGLEKDKSLLEDALHAHKKQREQEGTRAARGEKPSGVSYKEDVGSGVQETPAGTFERGETNQGFLGLNERGAIGVDKDLPMLIKQSWMTASKDQKIELEKATKELFNTGKEVNKLKAEIEATKDEVTKTALSKNLTKAEKTKADAVVRVNSINEKILARTSKPASLVERIDEIAATKKLATENSILLGVKKALGNVFEPMNDRLRKINGVVYSTVQREEFDNLQALTSYFTAAHGWTETMSALSKGNPKRNIIDKKTGEPLSHEEAKRIFDEYWSALRNPTANFEIDETGKRIEGFIQKRTTAEGEDKYRGAAYARYIANRYGFSEEHKAIRQIFDELQILRKAINPEAGELKYYFPAPIAYGKIEEFRGAVKQSRLRETGQNAVKQLMVDDKIPLDKFVLLSEEELVAIEKNLPKNINDIQRANIIAEAQANKAGYFLTPEKKATIAEEIKKEYNIIQTTDNVWDEALLKGTNEIEKEQIFNDLISGVRKPTLISGKKATPSRVYEIISDDIRRKYYMSPVDAFARAVKSTNDLVSEARMFGGFKSLGRGGEIANDIRKTMKGKPETEIETAIDIALKRAAEDIFYTEGSLGKAMMEEMKAGHLTKAGADEIRNMIQARYSRLPMHVAIRELRNLTYLMTMNSPLSALTQLKDLSMSMILHGGAETAQGLFETATQWESKLNKYARETGTPHQIMSRADLGMEHTIHELLNQDTASQKTLSKAVENLFSAVGIKQLDRIGKSTFVHAAQIKDARLATEWLEKGNRASPAAKRLNEQVKMFYRDPIEAENVMNELAARQNTEATRLIMFSEATHYYPITQTGVPEAYLRHPNWRLLYTLHMFTIKQINALSKHIAQEIKDNPAVGIPKLFGHLIGLAAIGASVDLIKDFAAGKDLSDYDGDKFGMSAMNNLLNVIGLSQFQLDQGLQGRNQALVYSLWKTILPAGLTTGGETIVDLLHGDVKKAIKMIPFAKMFYDNELIKQQFGY